MWAKEWYNKDKSRTLEIENRKITEKNNETKVRFLKRLIILINFKLDCLEKKEIKYNQYQEWEKWNYFRFYKYLKDSKRILWATSGIKFDKK